MTLHQAAGAGRADRIQEYLAGHVDLDALDATGRTALMTACEAGRLEAARVLLAAGADVTIASTGDLAGFTALHLAAGRGQRDLVEMLLRAGAPPHARGPWNTTPLHEAAFAGHEATVLLLLAHQGDIRAVKDNGSTALHDLAGAVRPAPKAVQALCEAGADVHARDIQGRTPLHRACLQNNQTDEIVRLLLAAGADATARDKRGRRPIDYARPRRKSKVVAMLTAAGAGQRPTPTTAPAVAPSPPGQ